jgi:sugar-specific transcriptional regulator TrmB
MRAEPIENLVKIGFSEYEAKAYVALLREDSPVTGYQLSKLSGVPRSMIYEVLGKLSTRGAAMTLRSGGTNRYTAVEADDFLDQLGRERDALISSLKISLTALETVPDLEYVWNIEGHENIIAKAEEMIDAAEEGIYLAILPDTFPDLEAALARALDRKVRVVLYTTRDVSLPGARIAVAHVSVETLNQARGLGLILVADRREVLIADWLAGTQATASWTGSPLLVFLAEHHLRTDLYLPQILAQLGDDALAIIQEEDRDLFARALESHIETE